MKRLCLIFLCAVLLSAALKAQTLFEAINLSDQPIEGTARVMAMSGAFGALGGDPSAIQINPAGLGIYRSSEISFTLADTYTKTRTNWGVSQKNKGENVFDFSRISYVQSFLSGREKGVIASNFAISYNRSKSALMRLGFTGKEGAVSLSTMMAEMGNGISELDMIVSAEKSPFDNEQVAWLPLMAYQDKLIEAKTGSSYQALNPTTAVAPTYNSLVNYAIDDIGISYATNINHLFYIGADFSLKLYQCSELSEYEEEDIFLGNQIETSGVGWNLKLGILARPFSFWRVGFAYHTPTFYHVSKTTNPNLNDTIFVEGSDAYRFISPSRYIFSTAFLFGKKAALDVEYEMIDYQNMRYKSLYATLNDGEENSFSKENSYIGAKANVAHSVKVGAEYRPFEFLSFRLGGAYVSPALKSDAEKIYPYNTIYTNMDYLLDKGSFCVSGGVGFRVKLWSFDLAYQFRRQMMDFVAFRGAEKAQLSADYHKVLLTCAYRF
jgi:hypothetical protein